MKRSPTRTAKTMTPPWVHPGQTWQGHVQQLAAVAPWVQRSWEIEGPRQTMGPAPDRHVFDMFLDGASFALHFGAKERQRA